MIEINLLPAELKARPKSRKVSFGVGLKTLLYVLPFVFCALIIAHILFAILGAMKNNRLGTLNKKLQILQPQIKELEGFGKEYVVSSEDKNIIQRLNEQRVGWSEKLNKLSLSLPYGIWFNELNVSGTDFTLSGNALSLQKKEMDLIREFMKNLKSDQAFIKDFTSLELGSFQHRDYIGHDVVEFMLSGKLKAR